MPENEVKLTKLAKCAGCGAKVGAGVLAQLLDGIKVHSDPNLLVGFFGVDHHIIRQELLLALADSEVGCKSKTDVADCEVESIDDVDNESECKHRDHDGHDWKCHEIASSLEQSVCSAIATCETVDDREQVDCHVKKQEKN